MSIHWPIIRQLLKNPARTRIVDDKRSYSGIELLVAALHVASIIDSKCTTPTVGVLTPTGAGFPIVALAAWMCGKVVVPLNYLLKKEELQYVIDDCETDIVFTAQPLLDAMGYTPVATSIVKLDALEFSGVPSPRIPATAADGDLAVLLYTSGTSGKPKGVMLSHGNLTANIDQILAHVEFGPSDIMLGVLPQFHSFGMTVLTLLPLTCGPKVVYTARFLPPRLMKLIKVHKPTALIAIPSMYNALLSVKDASAEDFASFRFIVSGGEPLPASVIERFEERFFKRLNEGYGLTETAPVTNWCRPFEQRLHSVGPPLPGVIQRIVDLNTGEEVPQGEEGEVQMSGPNIMGGYFKLPEESARAFAADGFFRSGDIGRFDADGHLYITGRLKEMLIIGGENVFPREIEEVLNKHPSVHASGVIGITDPMRGELPVAFVELNEGNEFDEQTLKTWCRETLAGYKVPTKVVMLDQLPRNPTGKIMRRELKKLIPPD